MTQRVEIHVSAAIPEGDGFIGHEAVVAARGPTDAVVKVLETKGAVDVKATCRLVNNKTRLPVVSGEAPVRAVPTSNADDEAA